MRLINAVEIAASQANANVFHYDNFDGVFNRSKFVSASSASPLAIKPLINDELNNPTQQESLNEPDGGLRALAYVDTWRGDFAATTTAQLAQLTSKLGIEDILVFVGLESLGTLAIIGNLCLITVLLKNKYLNRASFILMLSLAIADVLHGIVTIAFFYPPILLKFIPIPSLGIRIFNIIDWTAWSITLTHMSAICLDRLIAIMLYDRYNLIVTVKRVRAFTLLIWTTFFLLNSVYILLRVCCLIAPLRNNQFYTFGYGDFETKEEIEKSPFGATNLFTLTYTPLELTTIAVLSISNPIILVQLYRRHKRKLALRMASTMLLEMSMRMGSKAFNTDVRELAARRANRQQQRILLQISVVAAIFYLYMTTYYLVYHILEVGNKWVVLFNSFFYSTTHMINPVIYFSLNKEMRAQLNQAIGGFISWLLCVSGTKSARNYDGFSSLRRTSFEQNITATETLPLVPQQHHSLSKQQHLHYSSGNYAACAMITHDFCQDVLKNNNNEESDSNSEVDGDQNEDHLIDSQQEHQQKVCSPLLMQANGSSTASRHVSTASLAANNTVAARRFMEPRKSLRDVRDAGTSFRSAVVAREQAFNTTPMRQTNSMREAGGLIYKNREALANDSTQTSLSTLMETGHGTTAVDPMETLAKCLLKEFNQTCEHLQLDLISNASVDNFEAELNMESGANSKSNSRRNSGGGRRASRQTENNAFLNLARCLEEQARIFLEAENLAKERATRQRFALLDALIEALKSYKSEDSTSTSRSSKHSIGRGSTSGAKRFSYGNLGHNSPLSNGSFDRSLGSALLGDSIKAGIINHSTDVSPSARRRTSNLEGSSRISNHIEVFDEQDNETQLLLANVRIKLSNKAENLRRAISERNRLLEAAGKSFKGNASISAQQTGNSITSTPRHHVNKDNVPAKIDSSSSSFSQFYQFPPYQSMDEVFHHLTPSSSWRQWREMSDAMNQSRECASFTRLSRKEILRDSLLMLLEAEANEVIDTCAEEIHQMPNDDFVSVYICSREDIPTHRSFDTENDGASNEVEEPDEDEVVFL